MVYSIIYQKLWLLQGERNFNRFGGWLGKNSTMGKNYRLLEDLHVHLLASRESNLGRYGLVLVPSFLIALMWLLLKFILAVPFSNSDEPILFVYLYMLLTVCYINHYRSTLRLDNLTLLSRRLTEPLKNLSKVYTSFYCPHKVDIFFCRLNLLFYGLTCQDEAVEEVIEFMELYSISMEDFDTIVELSKFKVNNKLLLLCHLIYVHEWNSWIDLLWSRFRGIQVH